MNSKRKHFLDTISENPSILFLRVILFIFAAWIRLKLYGLAKEDVYVIAFIKETCIMSWKILRAKLEEGERRIFCTLTYELLTSLSLINVIHIFAVAL
jgi:hypothetical protein